MRKTGDYLKIVISEYFTIKTYLVSVLMIVVINSILRLLVIYIEEDMTFINSILIVVISMLSVGVKDLYLIKRNVTLFLKEFQDTTITFERDFT